MKTWFPIVAAIAACIPVAAQAAPNSTPSGYVTMMQGDLTNSFVRIQTDFNFSNPESCENPDGYVIDSAAGDGFYASMLLNAYVSNRKVSLILDGCMQGRPRITSVAILPT